MYTDVDQFVKAKSVGFDGYILKEYLLDEMVECINSKDSFISPKLKELLNLEEVPNALSSLNLEEKKIINLLAEYKSDNDIAEELFISRKKIQLVKNKLYKKLKLGKDQNEVLISWVNQNRQHLV